MKNLNQYLPILLTIIFVCDAYTTPKIQQHAPLDSQQSISIPIHTSNMGNMTEQQQQLTINVILSSQKKYNPPQYNDIAKYISDSLNQLIEPAWTCFVFTNRSLDAAVGAKAHLNKFGVFANIGTHNMTYVVIKRYRGQCITPSGKISNNQTRFQNYFGNSLQAVQKQRILDISASSTAYSGDDIVKGALFIQQKLTNVDGQQWNVIISRPSTVSGANACTINDNWGLLVGYGDLRYNYYFYQGIF